MVQRRWPDTIFFGAIGVGLLIWSASNVRGSFFWAAVLFVVGLAVTGLAVMGPASGPCPLCSKMIHGLFAMTIAEFERCPHCRSYFRIADRQEVPDDYVSVTPYFSVPLGEAESLPALCCVCAAPAERVKEVVHRTEGRVSHASPMGMKTELKIPVPYCGKHDEGVQIWNEDLAPSVPIMQGGQQITDHRWVLKVRSYRFYRAAVLN